jgi:hypothetical protein
MPTLTSVWVTGDYTDETISVGTVVANDEAEARELEVDLWFGEHQWSTAVCVDPCGSREVEWTVGQVAAGSYPGGAHLREHGTVLAAQDTGKTIYEREITPQPEPGPAPEPQPAPEPAPAAEPTISIDSVVVRGGGRTMLPGDAIPADEPLKVAITVTEHGEGWGGVYVSVELADGTSEGDWVDLYDPQSATVELDLPAHTAGTYSLTAAADTADGAGDWTRAAAASSSYTIAGAPAGMTKVNIHFRCKDYKGQTFSGYQFLASFTNEDGSETSAGNIEDGSPGVFSTIAYLSTSGSLQVSFVSTDEARTPLYGSSPFTIPAGDTFLSFDVEQRGGVKKITASNEDEFTEQIETELGLEVGAETDLKIAKVNGKASARAQWQDTVRSMTGQSTEYEVEVGKIRLDIKQAP